MWLAICIFLGALSCSDDSSSPERQSDNELSKVEDAWKSAMREEMLPSELDPGYSMAVRPEVTGFFAGYVSGQLNIAIPDFLKKMGVERTLEGGRLHFYVRQIPEANKNILSVKSLNVTGGEGDIRIPANMLGLVDKQEFCVKREDFFSAEKIVFASDNERLFAFFYHRSWPAEQCAPLYCFEHDGKLAWKKEVPLAFRPTFHEVGLHVKASSLVVKDDRVYLFVFDDPEGFGMLAFESSSGVLKGHMLAGAFSLIPAPPLKTK